MTNPASTSYDLVPYGSVPAPAMHPDCLATRAWLFGLSPPAVGSARVLELGCGTGGNLLALAVAMPSARFVGIDCSARQVEMARQLAGAAGIGNVEWLTCDIADIPRELGCFDYVLCHGVYSWVPRPLQEAVLACCARHLAADGVAFVSYNTYPGWKVRGIFRDLLCLHTRQEPEPQARIRRARGLLDFLVQAVPGPGTAYRKLVEEEAAGLAGVPDAYLYHEHLEPDNEPVYFLEFIERAAAHGLAYLDDPDFSPLYASLSPAARTGLTQLCPDRLQREQYLDFLCNRAFRQSLLCHASKSPARTPAPGVVRSLLARGQPSAAATRSPVHPLLQIALACLGEVWPGAVPFAMLLELVNVRLIAGGAPACDPDGLAGLLLDAYLTRRLGLHVHVPRFAAGPGPQPVGSPLARWQAAVGSVVVNLFHEVVTLDQLDRLVLCRLDGQRDRDALLAELSELAGRGELVIHEGERRLDEPTRLRQALEVSLAPALERLAGHALLVG